MSSLSFVISLNLLHPNHPCSCFWAIVTSLVFFYLSKLLFWDFLQFDSDFALRKNNLKYRDIAAVSDVSIKWRDYEHSEAYSTENDLDYGRNSINGHLSTTARVFLSDRAPIHTFYSTLKPPYNGHLSTTATYFCVRVAVVESFNCWLFNKSLAAFKAIVCYFSINDKLII